MIVSRKSTCEIELQAELVECFMEHHFFLTERLTSCGYSDLDILHGHFLKNKVSLEPVILRETRDSVCC